MNRTAARLLGHDNYLAQQRTDEAGTILADNTLLPTPNAFAQNEKTLNHLYLTHRLWEGTRPDSTVLAQIKDIADQCPRDGGWSVYIARSLYAMFEPEVFWEINEGCGGGLKPSSVITTPKAALSFVVMPNPASESLTLIAEGDFVHDLRFELLDLSGVVQLSIQIPIGQTATTVDVAHLSAGVYFYKAYGQSTTKSGKVVIVR